MSSTGFYRNCYPLGVQCGRQTWQALDLTARFRQAQRPAPTYFRHLLADYLRETSGAGLSAAQLELWATLNQVLRVVAADFLQRRGARVRPGEVEIGGRLIAMPRQEALVRAFVEEFPVLPVVLETTDAERFIRDLEERDLLGEPLLDLLLLYVQSRNPALQEARPLFAAEARELDERTGYQAELQRLDREMPLLDDGLPDRPQQLLERLLQPLRQADSLYDQLQLLRDLWHDMLPEELLQRIDAAFAQASQEGVRPDFPGEPDLEILDPGGSLDERDARFTRDVDWMPRTVLLAKSIYVWLEQLSRRYRRSVRTLEQIPDAELDALASYGFTSLWLIGIWQRSPASRKVKNLCGQLQVAASAYAIQDYRVADDLGGDAALDNLVRRCRERGIDLACDVVTNHTGIESQLLREHPDWFIQLPHPPYPGYRFTGPDLSEDPEYAIQIEDGYYDHSEAAVVCRYQHRDSGQVRYLYHGNDGTHLPWNDTVQLNYLLPEVREAMIRLVIAVARRFRIIRFDAAMTLAKKHFQRLWFPLPGGGSGVPSRQDHALSRNEFNRLFPVEFWRELVDRVQSEVPDTLLVAEAFWLMEGYFVRTLGMHRVYNSAFMNMLKQEANAKYRQTLKNILAFDPAILQRFVNFMSNPDEQPAIEQFGDGDKYFCVATLLATMPGLPMFGHGQLEGYREKYGMEYLAPRWEEHPDRQLLIRHQREIFPLLRRRALFSGAEAFQLYDFHSGYGVEEDVYAYSNRSQQQGVLILCNNSSKSISGWIGAPADMAGRAAQDLPTACAVDLSGEFLLMTDLTDGGQVLQPTGRLSSGGTFSMQPYARRVLVDFTPCHDRDGRWQRLWERYGDSGRPHLRVEYDALLLEDIWETGQTLRQLTRPERSQQRIARALETLTGSFRAPQVAVMSPEYILEILVRTRMSGSDYLGSDDFRELAALFSSAEESLDEGIFKFFDRLFNHRRFRPLLNCHYYDFRDWFAQEAFADFLEVVLQYLLFRRLACEDGSQRQLITGAVQLLKALRRLQRLAERSRYRVDELLKRLDRPAEPQALLPAGSQARRILFVASEVTPFAKSGGLADVAGSLPRELRAQGHDVRVVMPCYRRVAEGPLRPAKSPVSVEISLPGGPFRASVKERVHAGVPHYFIDIPEFFDRPELYATPDGDYPDNGLRFGVFCRAVLEMSRVIDFPPELLHVHDWQTGFLPLLLKTSYQGQGFFKDTRTLLTIHNLGYQGMFDLDLLRQLDLPAQLAQPSAMEYYSRLSVLKGGINSADLITTVSPTYCREIQGPDQGHGFDGILRERREALYGILNGLDQQLWNPAEDTYLKHAYSAGRLRGKGLNKKALQRELGLEERSDLPLVVVISRLDRQKGIELIREIWTELLEHQLQFALLGSGSAGEMQFWRQQQGRHPGQAAIHLTFDEGLSHRLYAAADLLLVPSLYEPCGLTQMIALRYGALPVVRRTGGLADTVNDLDEQPRSGNGFVFGPAQSTALLDTIERALEHYRRPRHWRALVRRGMQLDFSWARSAAQYGELYRQLIEQEPPDPA